MGYVRAKVRAEYDLHRHETDAERVALLLALADTQLDQVREQAAHLTIFIQSDPP